MKPELTDRKLQILAAVVREYSETGEPVGSKSLAADLNLSSATIRNEMSDLAELGLLEQPHTSAGRVPTAKGYRLYVNQLMHRQPLSERDKREIDDMLPGQVEDPGVLAEAAARALAELTDCAAVTTTPADDQATVKQVRVLPLSRQTVVVAALTSSGLMKSRICLVEGGVTPDMLEKFIRFAEEQLYGLPLSDFQQGLTQTLAVQMGDLSLLPIMAALQETLASAAQAELLLQGQSNLLKHRRFGGERAVRLLEFLSRGRPLLRILHHSGEGVQVVLGNETGEEALEHSGLVVSPYRVGDREMGSIGVIGPDRMDYEHIIPSLEYFAYRIGRLLSDALDEE